MALTPERKVKNKVVAILKEYGVYYFYPMSGGYGSYGVPDIVTCINSYFLAIECKAGKGTTTALQKQNIERIRDAGGIALIINEENIHEVEQVVRTLLSKEA